MFYHLSLPRVSRANFLVWIADFSLSFLRWDSFSLWIFHSGPFGIIDFCLCFSTSEMLHGEWYARKKGCLECDPPGKETVAADSVKISSLFSRFSESDGVLHFFYIFYFMTSFFFRSFDRGIRTTAFARLQLFRHDQWFANNIVAVGTRENIFIGMELESRTCI